MVRTLCRRCINCLAEGQKIVFTPLSLCINPKTGSGYAFDRVREQYPYAYSEVFDAIELPIKYNSHNRYFVDQDALALRDMRNFVPKKLS